MSNVPRLGGGPRGRTRSNGKLAVPLCPLRLGNLGVVQQQLGELEVYGPEHPEVAITLTNLGSVQQQLGELEAARARIGRAAGIFQRRLGPDHPHTKQARAILESLGG